MSATPPDIGQPAALNASAAAREVSIAAASNATATPSQGAPTRRLGLALAVIATAQLMVVLDATIVNVALPHIQTALHFSGTNLEWVVNAYTLAFGGLLLLGGRSGDLLGRRRIFIAGILLFSLASLVGGFATSEAWLLTARVVQGIGGAFAAPTALSLIAVTFPEGPPRNRAMGVYATMSISGAAVGLIAGGLLVQYADWRWVLFVNVPIGAWSSHVPRRARVLPESTRRRGSVRPAGRGHRDRSAWARWFTGCPTRPPPRTVCRTGATPRSSRVWWPRSCCWWRSGSSRSAAGTRWSRCGCCAAGTGPGLT